MNRDTKQLELLYEQTKSSITDFLLIENVDNFNWDKFWNYYIFCEQNFYPLYESCDLVSSTTAGDQFKVVATTGAEFEVYINYLNKSQVDNKLINAYVSDLANAKEIKRLQNTVSKTTGPILNINFRDLEHNVHITNKLGHYSFSVMSGIKDAIAKSLHSRSITAPDVIFFLVKEQRKIEFFKRVFKNLFTKLDAQYTLDTGSGYFEVYFYNSNL
ncbi:hypothetical protein EBU95_21555 [bacterium]|nr:hypothetical protein [bacterium]